MCSLKKGKVALALPSPAHENGRDADRPSVRLGAPRDRRLPPHPPDDHMTTSWNRREVVRTLALGVAGTAGASLLAGCKGESKADAQTAGTPPAGQPIKLGIIPLTDCASVVMAS